MRIYGNREIKTLSGQLTRPTLAKVRQALFNIWQGEIEGCRWLDLCAGSGSMGGEALCRGAKETVAIEQNSQACRIIRENWTKLVQDHQSFRILKGNIITRLSHLSGETFDKIYFDPPYESQLYEPVLKTITTYHLLDNNGEIAVEHDPKLWQAKEIENLVICRQKTYSNTQLTFYCNQN